MNAHQLSLIYPIKPVPPSGETEMIMHFPNIHIRTYFCPPSPSPLGIHYKTNKVYHAELPLTYIRKRNQKIRTGVNRGTTEFHFRVVLCGCICICTEYATEISGLSMKLQLQFTSSTTFVVNRMRKFWYVARIIIFPVRK